MFNVIIFMTAHILLIFLLMYSFIVHSSVLFIFSILILIVLALLRVPVYYIFYNYLLGTIISDNNSFYLSFNTNYSIIKYSSRFKNTFINSNRDLDFINCNYNDRFKEIFNSNSNFQQEFVIHNKSGVAFYYEIFLLKKIRTLIFRDITSKKLREHILIESEEKLRSVLEYNLNLYIYINSDWKISGFNRTADMWFENVMGITLSIGNVIGSIIPDSQQQYINHILDRVSKGEPVSDEIEMVSTYGEIIFLAFSIVPLFSNSGNMNGFSFMGNDVTKEKSYQNEIKALASIPEKYPDPVMRLDYSGGVIYSNTAAKVFLKAITPGAEEYLTKELWVQIVQAEEFTGVIQYQAIVDGINKVYSIKFNDIPDPGYINVIATDISIQIEKEKNINVLYEKLLLELDTASVIINFLLPDWMIEVSEYFIFSSYEPSSKIGGDLLDVIDIGDGKKFIYVGDVSGHGVQASLIMTAVKSIIKMIVLENVTIPLHQLLNNLQKNLFKDVPRHNYLTILVSDLDTVNNTITILNAGHPEPIIVNNITGEIELIDDRGSIPLGWDDSILYSKEHEVVIPFEKNKSIILYTDGLLESIDTNGIELGNENLYKLITKTIHEEGTVFIPHVLKNKLIELGYDISEDDYTVLNISRLDKNTGNSLLMSLKPDLNLVGEVGSTCYNFILNLSYNNHLAFKSELLINEILNNIIIHGTQNTTQSNILMYLSYDKSEIVSLCIYDNGIDWDITNWTNEDIENVNSSLSENGRGLHIIKGLSRDIKRQRCQNINKTQFIIYGSEI